MACPAGGEVGASLGGLAIVSDVQNENGGPKKKGSLKPVLLGVALIGVAGFLYFIGSAAFKPADAGGANTASAEGLMAFRTASLSKLEVPGQPKPVNPKMPDVDPGVSPPAGPTPDTPLIGVDGKPVTLADFKGKVVVLNMWATWCAPCKIEMPTLNALAAAYPTQPVTVLAASVDREADREKAKAEMAKYPALKLAFDDSYALAYKLMPQGPSMPLTVILDKKGVERARLSGEADWNSKEARALIETLLKES